LHQTILGWQALSPWLQGLFGGAGVTLLWEGIVKPSRERRSLAHVLAEEIGHNLQYAAGQRLYHEKEPKIIPGDFTLSELVFSAIADRLGELPELTGEIVLCYRKAQALNAIPEAYTIILNEYLHAKEALATGLPGVSEKYQNAQTAVRAHIGVYRSGLEGFVATANTLLPKLRRAATPWYRFDIRMRKPNLLSLEDLAQDANRLADQRRKERS
jgi:hypothetical protein